MRNLLLVIVMLSGCGGGPTFGDPTLTRHGGGCDGPQNGIVVLSWTIRGAAPSSMSCQGIDHLQVELAGSSCDVGIAPVPCALDRWRYDHLPEGVQTVIVTAIDASGRTVASGSADVNLTATAPASPTAIDLQ